VRDVSALGDVTLLGLITAIAAGFLVLDGKRHMGDLPPDRLREGWWFLHRSKISFSVPGRRLCRTSHTRRTAVFRADIP
jgi:hypothetical protein